MMTLPIPHKEHFEHWLASQPDDAGWVYSDCARCVGATFVRDIYKVDTRWGSGVFALSDFTVEAQIPDWLLKVINAAHIDAGSAENHRAGNTYITVQILRDCWRKLNPEPVAEKPININETLRTLKSRERGLMAELNDVRERIAVLECADYTRFPNAA